MCRNIRTLFNFEPPATEEEIRASALQFVRKLSGFTHPSRANEAAFLSAPETTIESSRPDPATGSSQTGRFTLVNTSSGSTQDVTCYAECDSH